MAARLYRNRVVGLTFIPFGIILPVFAMSLPFLLKDAVLGFILMGIPMLFAGLVMLLHGIAAASTRIEVAESGLRLAVPGWRAFPVPPARRASLSWNEVFAVRNRVEIYHIAILPYFLAIPFPVEVFAVETARGRFILGGRIGWLAQAMAEIARYAGCIIQHEGEIEARMFSTLFRGAPEWPAVSRDTALG